MSEASLARRLLEDFGDDELKREASRTAEALRCECEAGLRRVKYLMAYMALVSVVILPVVGILEWILADSQRGNLEDDWWKCLIHDNVELHYVESEQSEKMATVLAALLYQSCLLVWAALIVFQRSCIRMDWISSGIVNNLYTLLLIALPPFAGGWPAPTAVQASLITMLFYVKPNVFAQVPEPNQCHTAYHFCQLCVALVCLTVVSNVISLFYLCRAEHLRRRAVAAEKALFFAVQQPSTPLVGVDPPGDVQTTLSGSCDEETKQDEKQFTWETYGLVHRVCCGRRCSFALPRSIVLGGVMVASYVGCALSRGVIVVVAQRAFDAFTRAKTLSSTTILGGTVLIPTAPMLALGPSAAFLSFASILRGFSGDDLAPYRIAALLAVAALFVDLPAFAATVRLGLRSRIYNLDVDRCVSAYIFDRTESIYGFPSESQARSLCVALMTNFYFEWVHVVAIFFMAISSIRTFTLNDKSFDAVVEPQPADDGARGSLHLLQTDDPATFEFDLHGPPSRSSVGIVPPPAAGSPLNHHHHRACRGLRLDDARYSAIIIRPHRQRSLPIDINDFDDTPRPASAPTYDAAVAPDDFLCGSPSDFDDVATPQRQSAAL